jgi:hypothetical protein
LIPPTCREHDQPLWFRIRTHVTATFVDVRLARLLLGAVVVATCAVAIRYYDGHDFVNNVWAPIHGLLAGHNPYDTADIEYHLRYHVPVVAGLYLPTALLVHVPLALLSQSRSADVMALLDAALIWFGVLVLIAPRTSRRCLVAGIAGALLVLSAPAQDTIFLGQLSAEAFAGFALLVASLRKDPSATWLPAIGVTLVALKPQSAIPIVVALAVLQCWKLLARAAAILVVTSLPGALLFIHAAGGPSEIIRTVTTNLNHLSRLPPNDLTNPGNIRIDALGILSHLHGLSLTGLGWTAIGFAVATGLLVLALRAVRAHGPRALTDPFVVTVVTLYIVVSLVHLSYDQLLLYLGPLTALGAATESPAPSRSSKALAAGGIALATAGIVFRSGFRSRMMESSVSFLPIHEIWVTLPTLIVVAIVGYVLALDRHATSLGTTR